MSERDYIVERKLKLLLNRQRWPIRLWLPPPHVPILISTIDCTESTVAASDDVLVLSLSLACVTLLKDMSVCVMVRDSERRARMRSAFDLVLDEQRRSKDEDSEKKVQISFAILRKGEKPGIICPYPLCLSDLPHSSHLPAAWLVAVPVPPVEPLVLEVLLLATEATDGAGGFTMERNEPSKVARTPCGGSTLTLSAVCITLTGTHESGVALSHRRKERFRLGSREATAACRLATSCSRFGIHEGARWQFCRNTQSPTRMARRTASLAVAPNPRPSDSMVSREDMPRARAKRCRASLGSPPGARMNSAGVLADESAYTPLMSSGGVSRYSAPIVQRTKSFIDTRIWEGEDGGR